MEKWTCSCGAKNNEEWEYCPQCGSAVERAVDRYPELIYVWPEYLHNLEQGKYTAIGNNKLVKYIRADISSKKPQLTNVSPKNMVLVKAGTFTMGSPESEVGRYDDEIQHEVTISRDFYMSKYQVTQAEYERVMGHNPSLLDFGSGDDYPVNQVSWYDAVEYCNKLSEREGLTPAYTIKGEDVTWNKSANGYRLPTEAEWEYAARGGHKACSYKVYAGRYIAVEVGWFNNNSGSKAHPVGQKQPNGLELYDMSGNVYEWCWDWFGWYTTENRLYPANKHLPKGRVLRGGSWSSPAKHCRSANRRYYNPSSSFYYFGFRMARTATYQGGQRPLHVPTFVDPREDV